MKRTPLRRSTRLRRRTPIHTAVIEAHLWREGLGPCAQRHLGDCQGHVQGHHIIPKRHLRKLGFADRILDRRNRLSLCSHHHEQHETRYRPVPRELLPNAAFEFAAELRLTHLLDRIYPETAREATA